MERLVANVKRTNASREKRDPVTTKAVLKRRMTITHECDRYSRSSIIMSFPNIKGGEAPAERVGQPVVVV